MEEATRIKLLKIFGSLKGITTYLMKVEGVWIPCKKGISLRWKEKEEMKRLREEMKDEK